MTGYNLRISTLLIVFSIFAEPLGAQRGPETKASPRPGWHPREFFTDGRISAADRAIIEKNLAAAEALVVRIAGYATPRGFEVTPWWAFHPARSRDRLHDYQMQIHVHNPTKKAAGGGWSPALKIHFNPSVAQLSVGGTREESGQSIYSERPRSSVAYGATAVYGTFGEVNAPEMNVLFTSHDESPMLPVSRERYLRAVIFELEGNDPEELKRHKAAAARTPYEEWMSGAAQRKKEREETLAQISDKAQAAKMRAQIEKMELDVTEGLKKSETLERQSLSKPGNPSPGDQIRAQIAAMTPAERASQGWVIARQLVPVGTPGAEALVRENPAFYRARGSPFEPRAILVNMPSEVYKKVMGATQLQLYREFDWAALKRLLDERP
jgi:hypothetical protein